MPALRQILIVEDDIALRATLAEQLLLSGEFNVDEAGSAAEAEAKLARAKGHYDAILLDVGLPDANGRELCAKLRSDGRRMPILIVTGADAVQDVVAGLNAGANDYILKPFRMPELLARVRAQLRVFDSTEDASFLVGPYVFRPSQRLLLHPINNRRIRLTDKENALLKVLHRAQGRVVPQHTLLNEVWNYNESVNTHTLETHVYRLRQKIEEEPGQARLLRTERGGYKLTATVPISRHQSQQPDSTRGPTGRL